MTVNSTCTKNTLNYCAYGRLYGNRDSNIRGFILSRQPKRSAIRRVCIVHTDTRDEVVKAVTDAGVQHIGY